MGNAGPNLGRSIKHTNRMADMTKTPASELREQIRQALLDNMTLLSYEGSLDAIAAFITRECAKARIDELETTIRVYSKVDDSGPYIRDLKRRLDQLKAEAAQKGEEK